MLRKIVKVALMHVQFMDISSISTNLGWIELSRAAQEKWLLSILKAPMETQQGSILKKKLKKKNSVKFSIFSILSLIPYNFLVAPYQSVWKSSFSVSKISMGAI